MEKLQQGLRHMLLEQWEITKIMIKRGHVIFTCLTLLSERLKAKWKESPVNLIFFMKGPTDSQKGFELILHVVITTGM